MHAPSESARRPDSDRPAGGSAVTPVRPEPPAPAALAALTDVTGPEPARPATILVVDDEPLARQMLTDVLESQGFRVLSVARGEEVFGFLPDVDLVLLDAMLPGRDGWQICAEIKTRYDRFLPVIMVTARTSPDDVVRTFDAGADDYVAKPFHVAELIARIGSRLRVHRAELQLRQAAERLRELAEQNYRLYQQALHEAEERQRLLRELDHRVRNNLAKITGLVSMARNSRRPRSAEEALLALENRLLAFLAVHVALRNREYRGVPIREIAERIAQRIRNLCSAGGRVRLEVHGDPVLLDERQGLAVALALNELVTNSIRHAFPDGRSGTVRIELARDPDGFRLEVRDDGVGLPADLGPEPTGSGRSILRAVICDELRGRVEYLPAAQGTHVRVTFPWDETPPPDPWDETPPPEPEP